MTADDDFWDDGLVSNSNPDVDGSYHAYGEGVKMFKWLNCELEPPREAMVEGVAGSGKTRMMGEWIKMMCNTYPRSVGLVIRKTRVSLNESFLEIFENEVLGPSHPAVLNGPGRKQRDQYSHPSLGGRIVLGGMDNPVRLFSTQYHWCYVNEMQELTEEEWESLHRALRRRGLPFRQILIGDCNPEDEYHWANQRAKRGLLHRIIGRFTDNPTMTREYIERLRENLTGVRYQRLFLGKWVSAEGTIYEDWSSAKHLFDGRLEKDEVKETWDLHIRGEEKPVQLAWFLAGMDFGWTAPGCFQVWGFDEDKSMYLVAEVYRSKWDLDQWADAIERIYLDFQFRCIICDSAEPRSIKFLNDRLGPLMAREMPRIAIPADKTSKGDNKSNLLNGFSQVRWLLKDHPDTGKPRMRVMKRSLRFGRDPTLEGKPGCFEEEIVGYVHPKEDQTRSLTPEQREGADKRCADHAMDVTRYVALYAWQRDFTPVKKTVNAYPQGTYGYLFGDAASLHREKIREMRRSSGF